jgi:pimeloyl-ACP methyl ester carboxylesterase
MTTLSEGYITTQDGIRLFFQKAGSGPGTVIILNAAYLFDDFKYLADDHTLIAYDLRNRCRSSPVTDPSKLKGGVHNDVEDLETIRRHFDVSPVDLIGHSYLGYVAGLYAMKYPEHVHRVVQIGPSQPFSGKQYPPDLMGADAVMAETYAKMAELQKQGPGADPEEFGKKMWSFMRTLYVVDPADAVKITWSVAHLPNESLINLMKHFNEYIMPSMQATNLTSQDFAKVTMPVLTVHGRRDRHAPYGGGRDWALALPDARLLTIENAAHIPWIEAPQTVFGSVRSFLDGVWPAGADKLTK